MGPWRGSVRSPRAVQRLVMAHYLSNHVAVAYGDIFEEMVSLSQHTGFRIRILGAGGTAAAA